MRPIPIYNRQKSTRTWFKDSNIIVESFLEDPVHFIRLKVIINFETRVIKDIETEFIRSPYEDICPLTGNEYKKIIGLKIEEGFNKKVSEIIKLDKGCTHLTTLLREAADSFIQSIFYKTADTKEGKERRDLLKTMLKDTCLAYSKDYV
ncbi:MAG TPA: DUF2889 domain-containing protein [Spirochaetota bacterium]|nr:DUF2889 domain-containing protein [Spirochaetota bacterium]HOM38870.1 DUF2889 domain-containing protein [Spirochaetota bacterium]HPQ49165.1 DUF2889 domain-containing protein [Spirochaetota bacterium]